MLLAFGMRVLEALEGSFNIARHGDVKSAGFVVPVKCEATVFGAGPVSGHLVFGPDDRGEVFGMFSAHILDTKVIDDKAEGDGTGDMCEQAWGVFRLDVTMFSEVGDEFLIGDASGLGQAIHAFGDFNVDIILVHKGCKIVLLEDLGGNGAHGDSHVLRAFHVSVQVEVLDVHAHESATSCGEDAVEEEFGSDETRGLGAGLAGVINAVTTYSPADTALLGFLGAISNDDAQVGGRDAIGDFLDVDEADGVGACGHGRLVALGKATNFFTAGFLPEGAIRASEELGILDSFARVRVHSSKAGVDPGTSFSIEDAGISGEGGLPGGRVIVGFKDKVGHVKAGSFIQGNGTGGNVEVPDVGVVECLLEGISDSQGMGGRGHKVALG